MLDKKKKEQEQEELEIQCESEVQSQCESQNSEFLKHSESFAEIIDYKKFLTKNPIKKFQSKIIEMNETARLLIKNGKFKEALLILSKCEEILEFAANSGKDLDRNLIVVILFNLACEKCALYIDAVIFNLEKCIEQDRKKIKAVKKNLNINEIE